MKKYSKAIAAIMLMMMMFAVGCKQEEEPDNVVENNVEVTTYTPTDISDTEVTCGAEVKADNYDDLLELGFCWSESAYPTVNDNYVSVKKCSEPFIKTITGLTPKTRYHIRAYVMVGTNYYYGEDKSFTTLAEGGDIPNPPVNIELVYGSWTQFLWEEWDDDIQDMVSWNLFMGIDALGTIGYEYANNSYGIIAEGTYVVNNNTITATYDRVSVYIDDYGHTGTIHGFTNGQTKVVNFEIVSCTENELVVKEDIEGDVYHLERIVIPEPGGGGVNVGGTGSYNGHDYVDLGLPSGTLWATCNVGTNSPEGYGKYFAWGETALKTLYDWSTYKYCKGTAYSFTKYCNNSKYGYNNYTDELTVLQDMDDAATSHWGSGWCMPTEDQWNELIENTSCIWTSLNNVEGKLFSGNNGNSLFIPAAGYYHGGDLISPGSLALYWSASLNTIPIGARCFNGKSNHNYSTSSNRSNGLSVRPVRSAK